jgi:hypothetical protein
MNAPELMGIAIKEPVQRDAAFAASGVFAGLPFSAY